MENARAAGSIILDRLALAGVKPARTQIEVLGAGDTLPGSAIAGDARPWDVVLRVSAADPSRALLDRFVREFAPLVTAGPPGVTGYTGGRAKPHPVLAYWPTTVSRGSGRVSKCVPQTNGPPREGGANERLDAARGDRPRSLRR